MKKIIILFLSILLFIIFFSCSEDSINPNDLPKIKFKIPSGDLILREGEELFIIADVTVGKAIIKSVELYLNDKSIAIREEIPFEFSIRKQVKGIYYYKLKVTDNDDKSSFSEICKVTVLEPGQSYINVIIKNNEHSICVGDTIVFDFVAESPFGKIKRVELWSKNGALYGTTDIEPFSITLIPLKKSNEFVRATAIDDKNNYFQSPLLQFNVNENDVPVIDVESYSDDLGDRIQGYEFNVTYSIRNYYGVVLQSVLFIDGIPIDSIPFPQTGDKEIIQKVINNFPGEHTLQIKAYDNKGAVGESIVFRFYTYSAIPLTGEVVDLISTERDDLVIGFIHSESKLIYINPITKKIDKTFNFPGSGAVAFKYSQQNKKIYILFNNSKTLSVFDIITETIQEIIIDNPNIDNLYDVELNEKYRRILILHYGTNFSHSGLSIINMDSYETIMTDYTVEGMRLACNDFENLIFTIKPYSSPTTIYQYSIENDKINLIKQKKSSDGVDIIISPDKRLLVVPGAGNYSKYLWGIDAKDIEHIYGQWDLGTYPVYANFSYTGNMLLGCNDIGTGNGDKYIYLMDAKGFGLIKNIELTFNLTRYSKIVTNASENKLIVFTFNKNSNRDFALFFFDI